MRKLKLFIYFVAKFTGVFAICRSLTKDKLRILCYHGISLDQEHVTFEKLFMQFKTFEKRMRYLKDKQYPVLSLEEGVERLYQNNLKPASTVITFDDGWSGVHGETSNLMNDLSFPWTLYVTTYYMQKQTQVFNIVFQHMLSKTTKTSIDLKSDLELETDNFPLTTDSQKQAFYDRVFGAANTQLTAEARQKLLLVLAEQLEVNIDWIIEGGCFKNINSKQCKELYEMGVDIQLHTHRHRFPPHDLEDSKKEILDNKKILEVITGKTLHHLCYPSGEHSTAQYPILEELDVHSATVVENGLNDSNSHKYELTRFLDGENIHQIEFEAEMSGFSEYLRKLFH